MNWVHCIMIQLYYNGFNELYSEIAILHSEQFTYGGLGFKAK